MRIRIALLSFVGTALLVSSSAMSADDKPLPVAAVKLGRPVDFQKDIYPILDKNCVACHNLAIKESDLVLEDVKSILKGGASGPAVIPKKPEESYLFQVAAHIEESFMPPLPNKVEARSLNPNELGLLKQWILEGATPGSGSSGGKIQWQVIPSDLNAIYSVALSPWGRFAASGRSNNILIYDVVTGEEVAQLNDPSLQKILVEGKPFYQPGTSHRDFVHSLAFSPDGNTLASGGYRVVKIWKRQNIAQFSINLPNAVTAVAVSQDGKWAAAGIAGNAIALVNLAEKKVVKTLAGHTAAITGVQFTTDGTKLVSSSADKSIRVWNVSNGAAAGQIITPAPINDVVTNLDGSQIITAHADNIIRVWKTADTAVKPAEGEATKPALEIKGHSKAVNALALLLPAGTQLVSGSEDATVRIWNLADGKQIRSLNHGGPVTDVAVRPDGVMLASASANGSSKLWQSADGKQIAEVKGDLTATRLTSTKTEAQTVAQQKLTLATNAQTAADKDVTDRTAALKKANEAKTAADKVVVEAQKKSTAAAEVLKKANVTKDAATKKSVVDTAALAKALAAKTAAEKVKTVAQAALKVATDKKTAADKQVAAAQAVVTASTTAKAAADKLATATAAAAKTATDQAAAAKAAADAAKDNKALAATAVKAAQTAATAATTAKTALAAKTAADKKLAADNVVLKTTQTAQAATVKVLTTATQAAQKATVDVTTVTKAFTTADAANKVSLAAKTKADAAAKAPEAEATKQAAALKKATSTQASAVRSIQRGDKSLKSSQAKAVLAKTLKETRTKEKTQSDAALDVAKKAEPATVKPARSVAFSQDGKKLVTTGDDLTLHLWDSTTGQPLETSTPLQGIASSLAAVSESVIISGSADKKLTLWKLNPEWALTAVLGPKKEAPLDLGASQFVSRVLSIDFSPDGKLVATGGGDPSRSGELMLWDVATGNLVRNIEDAHSDTIFDLDFSRDGKLILSGAADKFVKIFEVATGKFVKSFEGHTHHVLGVGWKADGSVIASAGADNAIKVWNVETGEQNRTIAGYAKQVTALQFVGVGENIISCGGDKTVRFHRTTNGQNYRSFAGATDYVYASAASRDEKLVVAGGEDGVLRVWNGTNGKVLKSFEPPKPPEDNSQAKK